jgi:hypothetical protein
MAAERQYLAENDIVTPTDEQKEEATRAASAKVRLLLPTSHVVDASKIMRDRGVVGALLVFHRFWNQAYNLSRSLQGRDLMTWRAARTTFAGGAMGFLLAYSILGSLARGQGKQPDESWPAWFIRQVICGAAGQFVGGGDAASSLWSLTGWSGGKKREPRNNSLAGMGQGIATLAAKAADGDKDADERIKAAAKAWGLTTGFPPVHLIQPMTYLWDLQTGRVNARGPGDVAGGVVFGQSSRPDANPFTIGQDLAADEPVGTGPH